MAWLDDMTAHWRLRSSLMLYTSMVISLSWLMGFLLRLGLERLRLNYLTSLSLGLFSEASITRSLFLSEAYSWLITLVIPLSVGFGLWLGIKLFQRDKLEPWLRVEPNTLPSANRDELARMVSQMSDQLQQTEQTTSRSRHRQVELDRQVAHLMHELNNPLTTIKGDIELLRLLSSDSTIQDISARLERNERRLERLIKQFRQEEGSETEPVMATYEWTKLWQRLQLEWLYHRPEIRWEAADINHQVQIDLGLFLPALNNIIDNASRYAREQIVIRASNEASRVHLTICDDGPGFSPAALVRGYENYYTESADTGHLGYGLYQANKSLVRQGIELKLFNGAGACVELAIPWYERPGD